MRGLKGAVCWVGDLVFKILSSAIACAQGGPHTSNSFCAAPMRGISTAGATRAGRPLLNRVATRSARRSIRPSPCTTGGETIAERK
jgi:hypothetical protein